METNGFSLDLNVEVGVVAPVPHTFSLGCKTDMLGNEMGTSPIALVHPYQTLWQGDRKNRKENHVDRVDKNVDH